MQQPPEFPPPPPGQFPQPPGQSPPPTQYPQGSPTAQYPPAQYPPAQYPPAQYPPAQYPPQGPYATQPWPGTTPAPYAARPARPGSVTAASVLLIILAVPPILFAIAAFVGAGLFHSANGRLNDTPFSGFGDAVARVAVVFGIVSLAYGVTKLIAGIRSLAGRNAWRVTGIVLSAVGAAFWVLTLIGSIGGNRDSFQNHGPNGGGIVLSLIFLAMNLITLILLGKAGDYFHQAQGQYRG
jgi:hypothetical protein